MGPTFTRKKGNYGVDVYAAIGIAHANLVQMHQLPTSVQEKLNGRHTELLGEVKHLFETGKTGGIIPHTVDVQSIFTRHNDLIHELPPYERGQFTAVKYKEKRQPREG
jgi:hypothetical protein